MSRRAVPPDVPAELAGRIAAAADASALAALTPQLRETALAALADDAGPARVARLISALNDLLSARLVALAAARHRLPAASWCWLSLGSEGRGEQTLATDQDNGLLFSAGSGAEARELRRLFLPFAAAVNADLDACGIPLCTGKVMAGNPDWCLSLDEWRERFFGWIRTPDPKALLNATIFFDFRALCGADDLAATLRAYLTELAAGNDVFLRMLAANALDVAPPLGLLGDVVGEDAAGGRVDLKKFGSRLFVDAARVLALAAGVPAVNTLARLRGIAGQPRMPLAAEAEAAAQACLALLRLRLECQRNALARGAAPDNRIDPAGFNDFDRRLLREALHQARRLQTHLRLGFGIGN